MCQHALVDSNMVVFITQQDQISDWHDWHSTILCYLVTGTTETCHTLILTCNFFIFISNKTSNKALSKASSNKLQSPLIAQQALLVCRQSLQVDNL